MTSTVTATQAREQFADIINRVVYRGEQFIIEKKGKPVARIVMIEEKQKETITKNEPDQGLMLLKKLSQYNAKGLPKDLAQNHDKYAWGGE
ncbi:hypothetical protein A2690_00735 [Candidatus Roizmanbacteria bacterium RIFCSPHIGHO2_01_FULL_39_12b]|uniref:Antitoxin n=1 Tax=Candidatus Roizmanbacteria bacterium RIFCSPHIGHO2_01_FULL_39_12b TaxID=1802030 RepID=A0A1F7GB07_9BACT|nr:MAG: hypothetical protein A2690_00735 [Candidatus Roizmanbacteria bacterium RIFCSPHIGHO2_01_FULL_39_12b]OGK46942.1 MAG: hypothetical protein A3B46_03440 [Candidatus Roizmanbacteria bacterium RIFCSPLOWO2_01_FULL_39_19]